MGHRMVVHEFTFTGRSSVLSPNSIIKSAYMLKVFKTFLKALYRKNKFIALPIIEIPNKLNLKKQTRVETLK